MLKLIFIRHAFRADQSFYPEDCNINEISFDTHLGKVGQAQAECTGRFLSDYLSQQQYDILRFHSSPMVRCLETSREILKSIQIDKIHNRTLFIDPTIKEVFNLHHANCLKIPQNYIDQNKFPMDAIHQSTNSKQINQLFSQIEQIDLRDTDDLLNIEFPEEWPNMTKNRKNHVNEYIKKYSDITKNTIIVNVTHAGVTSGVVRNYTDMRECYWCSVSVINVDLKTEEVTVELKGYKEHLDKEGLIVPDEFINKWLG